MVGKKGVLTISIFVLVVLSILIVGCEEKNIEPQQNITVGVNEPNYDPKLLEEFNKAEWVPVLVRLKDNSNITIIGTKEEKIVLMKQRDEWFQSVIDEVLATIPENEFKLSHKLFNGFSGKITKDGFNKLRNNPAIREIIWQKTPPPSIPKIPLYDN